MTVHKFASKDGPPERALLFSMADRSYKVGFAVDAPYIGLLEVSIEALAKTNVPTIFAWRGYAGSHFAGHHPNFWAWGLHDTQNRDGIVLAKDSELPSRLLNRILKKRLRDFHRVELKVPSSFVTETLSEGPSHERLLACESAISHGYEPTVVFRKESDLVRLSLRALKRESDTWFLKGFELSGFARKYIPFRGLWNPVSQQGFTFGVGQQLPMEALARVETLKA